MIEVRWFSSLVDRTHSKLPRTTVSWQHGITPRTIFVSEGFNDVDADHTISAINGEHVDMNTPLKDGDKLEFLVGISGGTA